MLIRISDFLRKIFPWFVRHYNRIEIKGIENLPQKNSAIIAPNHSGGLDLDNFCLMSALEHFKTDNNKRKRIWLCYWDKWSIGDNYWARFVKKFSPIPISLTGGGIPYDLVDKIVKRGELIAIMPEGHSASIKEGYLLWKFYPGVIKLHLKYKIPIIPTAMIGFLKAAPLISNKYNPNKIPPWEDEIMLPFIFPKKLIIHFNSPISFDNYFNTKVDKVMLYKLAKIVRNEVKKTISLYRIEISKHRPLGKKKKNF
ncbi:MAG: lysophospholipid acyltransferase family protein [Candidatus Helarchaeota archaeon]